MIRIFYLFRIYIKFFGLKVLKLSIQSFCKECGRRVHDFVAPDLIWGKVDMYIKRGHVLCYDCFCEYCKRLGLPWIWELRSIENNR